MKKKRHKKTLEERGLLMYDPCPTTAAEPCEPIVIIPLTFDKKKSFRITKVEMRLEK